MSTTQAINYQETLAIVEFLSSAARSTEVRCNRIRCFGSAKLTVRFGLRAVAQPSFRQRPLPAVESPRNRLTYRSGATTFALGMTPSGQLFELCPLLCRKAALSPEPTMECYAYNNQLTNRWCELANIRQLSQQIASTSSRDYPTIVQTVRQKWQKASIQSPLNSLDRPAQT